MPKLLGITVSVISHYDQKQHPEFPHPDTSQFSSKIPPQLIEDGLKTQKSNQSPPESVSKADKILGRNASASVYIPSLPGARFLIKYTISPPHLEGQLFYFKLYMNGRHISSWGVNPVTKPRGQVGRAIFEADSKWDYNENGKSIKHGVAESRSLYFAPASEEKSAGDDGGLFNVLVFRAKGKRRRTPQLETYRAQEKYGLMFPSAGLLDKPQDTRYYEWLLIDPKDQPYATFHFHYRSWNSLESLHLIPQSYTRKLLPTTHSIGALEELLAKQGNTIREGEFKILEEEIEDSLIFSQDPAENETISNIKRRLPSILKKANSILKKSSTSPKYADKTSMSRLCTKSSPPPKPQKELPTPISSLSVSNADLKLWSNERPLPEPPRSTHSRKSSANSIATSILSWADRESRTSSPEPTICTAFAVPVGDKAIFADDSMSKDVRFNGPAVDTPPPSTINSKRSGILPPSVAVFLPPNVTMRRSRLNSPDSVVGNGVQRNEWGNAGGTLEEDDPFLSSTLTPSEAEWLAKHRVPSPIKEDPVKKRLSKIWSPNIDKLRKLSEDSLWYRAKHKKSWYTDVDADGEDCHAVETDMRAAY